MAMTFEPTTATVEKFWRRVPHRPAAPDECWPWIGSRLPKGYGTFCVSKRLRMYAHRVVWILTGSSFDAGEEIDHACKNPSCVRPEHLSAVPKGWNGMQGNMTQHKRVRSHCKRGHALTPENVWTMPSAWRPARLCRTCQRWHGLSSYYKRQRIAKCLSVPDLSKVKFA